MDIQENARFRPESRYSPPWRHAARPVKQSQRVLRPDIIPRIETEVNKLNDVGFIREVKYPTWISRILPVKKKNGQIRICVDFQELNKACPKDDFPLPIIELMVDATTGHEALSFMDGSSGYNQIRMSPKDEECMAFRTPKGIYCYKNVECYVDDLVVKTKKREEHLADLQIVFDRLRKYNLKMNPLKCVFGVSSGNSSASSFAIVALKSILKSRRYSKDATAKKLEEVAKFTRQSRVYQKIHIKPRWKMPTLQPPHEERRVFLVGEGCQNAFESIKRHLLNPPVLGAPTLGKPLILYIAAQERSIGALMAQENEEGKEKALYYLSRTLTENELKYSPVEKVCLALFYAIKKLRHYFEAYSIRLISCSDPVKFVMS
ncbi:UNVERIFIED_CONTAM: Transposon Tf2-12 polyprotein [Sesamum radiatum]|uniref:Transposon Tf2-12 polyprotein n=1 Tax=Sesamum radiatum TaxID=300843 RepID=A0AAW2R3U8_SESRA